MKKNNVSEKKIKAILSQFPKLRTPLPEKYQKIYEKHYSENRNAETTASKITALMEGWGHRNVAKTVQRVGQKGTLEIGAGTLNQFQFERKKGRYDIVEPYKMLYENSQYRDLIDHTYTDISDVPLSEKYDRITSVYCFEHVLNLPDVIRRGALLLTDRGVLSIAIPNEGRFLWKFAYQNTSGREFRRRYGLDYDVMMHYEHVNTADEIEILLRYYFKKVDMKLFGLGREFAFYRYFCCSGPIFSRCSMSKNGEPVK